MTNRRSFFKTLTVAAFGFSILPPATTYERVWKAVTQPRIISIDSSCGCTLTRASIQAMTPELFAAQGFKELDMDEVFQNAWQSNMAGVPERNLSDIFLKRYGLV